MHARVAKKWKKFEGRPFPTLFKIYPRRKYYGDFTVLQIVATALEIKGHFLLFSIVELIDNIQIKHELHGEPDL